MFYKSVKFWFLFFLLPLLFISGCGIWSDFTTYFNLYYNTTDLFDKVEEQINAQKKELFTIEEQPLPGTVTADLQKIIEKCSNILQFNSESSYADDALLILGKSFYYQKNFQKSQRQLETLIAAYPESEYILEAKLWIGKCRIQVRDYTEGLAMLGDVRSQAIEAGEDQIVEDSYIEEIIYRKFVEDYPGAIETANEFLNVSDNDEIKAEVWYEVGNLNLQVGEIENAVTAYQNVFNYSPGYDLEVEAKLKLGRALRETGQNEQALSIFEDMHSEDKYEDRYADIEFERGKTLGALGRYDEALVQLTEVDTSYRNTPSSGAANFEKGNIYEHGVLNLDSAAAYYLKASTITLPKEYLEPAKEKNRLFQRYKSLKGSVNSYNKQLFYHNNPEIFIRDSIQYVEDSLAVAKEISKVKELQAIWSNLDSLLNITDTTGYYFDSLKVIDTLLVSDTLYTYDSTLVFNRDSVFAILRNPPPKDSLDSLVVAVFDSMFSYKIFNPDLQQKEIEQRAEKEQYTKQLVAELPDTLKFKNNPPRRPVLSRDSLSTLLAKNELDLGNLFLSELNLPDSAYYYYNNILTDFPNTAYHATTLFAMGSYYLTVDEKKRADSLFNIIYENYKDQSIVNAAADKLNKPFIDLSFDPAKDDYIKAERKMLAGNDSSAIADFYKIFRQYPESQMAPKALFTCGWILENKLDLPDSAVAFYDTLVAHYPATEYVRKIAPKLSFYKQELHRIELAMKDSLNHFTVADSLALDSLLVEEEINAEQDSVQVAVNEVNEKPKNKEKEKQPGETKVNGIKEPVWNPRIHK